MTFALMLIFNSQPMSFLSLTVDKNLICLLITSSDSATSKAASAPMLPLVFLVTRTNPILRFMKLGLQGHSILFASGDDGVSGPGDNTTNGCLGDHSTIFSPAWPNR